MLDQLWLSAHSYGLRKRLQHGPWMIFFSLSPPLPCSGGRVLTLFPFHSAHSPSKSRPSSALTSTKRRTSRGTSRATARSSASSPSTSCVCALPSLPIFLLQPTHALIPPPARLQVILYPGTYLYYRRRNAKKAAVWNSYSSEQKSEYLRTTRDEGNRRLDFQFAT